MLDLIENIIDEVNFKGIVRKQRSINRLFPDWPDKVKGIANLGGLRMRSSNPDEWFFKIHSGTKSDVWYDVHLRFKNVDELLGKHVKDRRLWVRDKSKVDMRKLSKKMLYGLDLQIDCSCPAALYWGPDYILSLGKYDAKYGRREIRPPKIRNPKQYGIVCKHLQNLLNVLPWYESTMAKWLNEFYGDKIRELEGRAKEEFGWVKKAGVELGKKKEETEEEGEKEEVEKEEEVEEGRIREKKIYIRDINYGWINRKGKYISTVPMRTHADYAKAALKRLHIGTRGLRLEGIVRKYLEVSKAARVIRSYYGDEFELSIQIASRVSSVQLKTIKEYSDEVDEFFWDIYNHITNKYMSGSGYRLFVSTLRQLDLLEKIKEKKEKEVGERRILKESFWKEGQEIFGWLDPEGRVFRVKDFDHRLDALDILSQKGYELDDHLMDNLYKTLGKETGYIRLAGSGLQEIDVDVLGPSITKAQFLRVRELANEFRRGKFFYDLIVTGLYGEGIEGFEIDIKQEGMLEEEEVEESRMKEAIEERLGDCYRLAGRYVMDHPEAILVHGTINGVRFTGKDFDNPHAWIEEGEEVYDLVWDKRFPKEVYYGMMQVKVNKKYDWDEMSEAIFKAKDWGPWEEEVKKSRILKEVNK